MLKRLRFKFVSITMAIAMVMLCVVFGLLLNFTAQDLERQSTQFMRQLAAQKGPSGRPGGQSKEMLPGFVLRQDPQGQLEVIGGGGYDLSDEAFLREIWEAVIQAGPGTGILEEYDLRYLYEDKGPGNEVVYADISGQRQVLRSLTFTCVFVGAMSFFLLLGLSLALARWAMKPVENAWREQRQFVADASHELKTPLTVILTNAELLETTPENDPRRRQFISSISSMSQQMRGLVEGLLELARVDNGAVRQTYTALDLSMLAASTALPFEAVFFEAGLTLQTQIAPELRVKGSAAHLRQVVEILLDNACKYGRKDTTVTLGLTRAGSRECRLWVESWGDTIGEEDLKNLFQRFYRVDKARSMNRSYGLGLAIAKAIVQDHNGRIWAKSQEGRNTFFVHLPLQ